MNCLGTKSHETRLSQALIPVAPVENDIILCSSWVHIGEAWLIIKISANFGSHAWMRFSPTLLSKIRHLHLVEFTDVLDLLDSGLPGWLSFWGWWFRLGPLRQQARGLYQNQLMQVRGHQGTDSTVTYSQIISGFNFNLRPYVLPG
jgi:hypothetical protein